MCPEQHQRGESSGNRVTLFCAGFRGSPPLRSRQKIIFTSLRMSPTWIFKAVAMRPASLRRATAWYDSQMCVPSRGANNWRSFSCCCADRRWNKAEAAQSDDVSLVAPLWQKEPKGKAPNRSCFYVLRRKKPASFHTGCRWSLSPVKVTTTFPFFTTHRLPGAPNAKRCLSLWAQCEMVKFTWISIVPCPIATLHPRWGV